MAQHGITSIYIFNKFVVSFKSSKKINL